MKTSIRLIILMVVLSLLVGCGGKGSTVAPPASGPTQAIATSAPEASAAPATAEPGAATAESPYENYIFATPELYREATGNTIAQFGESPMLAEEVKSGKLPPVSERLPKDVFIVRTREGDAARYGGEMHLLGSADEGAVYTQFTEDTQQGMFMLDAGYTQRSPNIIKNWELSQDGKTLTVYLREGMKWSDGADFTADDFVFWYEDILLNADLNPEVPDRYVVAGEVMKARKIDAYTMEYTFAAPYFRAVERVLGGDAIYRPMHYLKQYLPKYNPDAEALAKQEGLDSWQLAMQARGSYDGDPNAPQLNAWILKDVKGDSALWVRNPYYWRVDTAGNQLPYIDTLLVTIGLAEGTPPSVKMIAGEDDWDCQGVSLADYPVLKEKEADGVYKVYLYPDTATSTALGFALNYTVKDPVLREIFGDLRFRQALSLAIDREDISETVFLGKTVAFTAPASPIWSAYEDWMGSYYAELDVDKANALLDDMGLKWDEAHQWRLRADGKPVEILGEYTVNWLGYTEDVLQIVATNWAEIGVKLTPEYVAEETLMSRYVANEQQVGIWNSDGGSEALARAAYPIRLEPPWHWMGEGCCAMSSYPWRQWLDTQGAKGEEPPQQIKDLYQLVDQWLNTAAGTPEYDELINQILRINVENLYYFGTVSAPPRVVVVNNRIGNMPAEDGSLGSEMLDPYLPDTAFIRQ